MVRREEENHFHAGARLLLLFAGGEGKAESERASAFSVRSGVREEGVWRKRGESAEFLIDVAVGVFLSVCSLLLVRRNLLGFCAGLFKTTDNCLWVFGHQ